MSTEKFYYDFSSAAPFEAEILELFSSGDGNIRVILNKTIFYPEGGGQPADRGTINGVPLLDVREKDGEILHVVSAGMLKPGKAELILDSRRRRDLTVLHTGQHLLSATLLHMTGAPTVSMHLGDETSTIDVDTANLGSGEISNETLIAVEEAVADAIEENHPVIIHLCPPEDVSSFPLRKVPPEGEDVLRVVEIEGNDFIACCGTHVKTTAEIGLFRVLGAEKYKGMTRISFTAGRRLLHDCRLLRQNAVMVSQAISVPLSETGKGLLKFLEKTAQTEKRLKVLEEKAAQAKAEALLCKASASRAAMRAAAQEETAAPAIVVEAYADEGINELLNIGKIAQKQSRAIFILASVQSLKFAAFCSDTCVDLRSLIKDALEAHCGRGGGSPSFFQGSFGTKDDMDAFLKSIVNVRTNF